MADLVACFNQEYVTVTGLSPKKVWQLLTFRILGILLSYKMLNIEHRMMRGYVERGPHKE